MTLDLTDDEAFAFAKHLRQAIDNHSYPLALRLDPLKAILAKLDPPPPQPEPLPRLKPGMGPSLGKSDGGSGRLLPGVGTVIRCFVATATFRDGEFPPPRFQGREPSPRIPVPLCEGGLARGVDVPSPPVASRAAPVAYNSWALASPFPYNAG